MYDFNRLTRLSVKACDTHRCSVYTSVLVKVTGEKPQRRGSVGSLDSGMSISFQSTSASTVSRDSSPQQSTAGSKGLSCSKTMSHQQSFLGGLFGKRERKSSRSEEAGHVGGSGVSGNSAYSVGRSTEV